MSKKIAPEKINRILDLRNVQNIKKVDKPMSKFSLEIFLKNNKFTEEDIREIMSILINSF